MNIFKLEIKTKLKPFIIWTTSLMVFIIIAMIEYKSFGDDVNKFLDLFPKPVMIILGMNPNVDITKAIGYYSLINYYFLIALMFYGISLGSSVIKKEEIDKTYEYLFTKPVTRNYVLISKILGSILYIFLINLILLITNIITLSTFGSVDKGVYLFFITNLLLTILFFTFSIFLNTLSYKNISQIIYLKFLFFFIMGIVYDFKSIFIIQILTPLKYFDKIVDHKINIFFIIFVLLFISLFTFFSFVFFNKKDLKSE